MVALFAVGMVTGTILSFEMGLLWPNFTGTFGAVFGLGFAIEGFSFFLGAWPRRGRRTIGGRSRSLFPEQPSHAITHIAISSAYLPIAVCDFRSATRA
jgi:hypothetical protein